MYSIFVNGRVWLLLKKMQCQARGPSPLCVICNTCLGVLKTAGLQGSFKFHPRCKPLGITHFIFKIRKQNIITYHDQKNGYEASILQNLYFSNMKAIHKIHTLKRGITKAPLKDPPVSFTTNAPKLHAGEA